MEVTTKPKYQYGLDLLGRAARTDFARLARFDERSSADDLLALEVALEYRPLGRTGWNVSAISFGAWAIGGGGWAFGAFLLAMGVVVVIALDIPSKAATSAGSAVGRAGFTVSGYQIVGLNRMNRALVDAVIVDELRQASDSAGGSKPAQPLVDVADIRNRLLRFGWVRDARVSRRPSSGTWMPSALVLTGNSTP